MITRLVRFVALWCLAIFALTAASGAHATTYDFTFDCGAGCGITNGMINVFGGNVTSISGTASGLSAEGLNGAFSFNSALVTSSSTFTSSSSYGFNVATNNETPTYVQFVLSKPGTSVINYAPAAGSPLAQTGNSTVVQGVPTPVAGSGLMSFLMLGFAALMFRAKLLWWKVRASCRAWRPSSSHKKKPRRLGRGSILQGLVSAANDRHDASHHRLANRLLASLVRGTPDRRRSSAGTHGRRHGAQGRPCRA